MNIAGLKDIGIRAAKTAIQAGVAVLGTNVAGWTSLSAIKGAGIVALAAGASVVLNAVLLWANS